MSSYSYYIFFFVSIYYFSFETVYGKRTSNKSWSVERMTKELRCTEEAGLKLKYMAKDEQRTIETHTHTYIRYIMIMFITCKHAAIN